MGGRGREIGVSSRGINIRTGLFWRTSVLDNRYAHITKGFTEGAVQNMCIENCVYALAMCRELVGLKNYL